MIAPDRDIVLLFATRFARMFAYGLVSIVLVAGVTGRPPVQVSGNIAATAPRTRWPRCCVQTGP